MASKNARFIENTIIYSGNSGGDRWYIGLIWDGASFGWSSGSAATYRDWRFDEPNNTGDCVTIEETSDNWRDISCSSFYRYICEKKIGEICLYNLQVVLEVN